MSNNESKTRQKPNRIGHKAHKYIRKRKDDEDNEKNEEKFYPSQTAKIECCKLTFTIKEVYENEISFNFIPTKIMMYKSIPSIYYYIEDILPIDENFLEVNIIVFQAHKPEVMEELDEIGIIDIKETITYKSQDEIQDGLKKRKETMKRKETREIVKYTYSGKMYNAALELINSWDSKEMIEITIPRYAFSKETPQTSEEERKICRKVLLIVDEVTVYVKEFDHKEDQIIIRIRNNEIETFLQKIIQNKILFKLGK